MSGAGERPARPLRVHRVIARLNVGGPAMHVVNLATGLDAVGPFRTRLVAGSISPEEGDMAYYAEERGVPVTYVPEMGRAVSPLDDVRALWKLVRLFRRDRPDIVHTHTAKAGTLGRLAAIMAGVPVRVHTFHGHVLGGDYFSPGATAAFRQIERHLSRFTQRILVLTEGQKHELAEVHRVAPPGRFEVVPLGLDLKPFLEVDRERRGPEVRRRLGIGPEEKVVGIVGRLVPIKNHELALEAMAELVAGGSGRGVDRVSGASSGRGGPTESGRRGDRDGDGPQPDVRLLVVGGGEREGDLRRYARSLGVADRVTWLGWRDDLPDLYAAMDCLALTSHDEGTPVAVIEALVAGVPVVARAVGGVPEVLHDARAGGPGRPGGPGQPGSPGRLGRLGRLVKRAEPRAVAGALREVLDGDGDVDGEGHERSGLPRAVRAEVAERYSVERLARDVARVYTEETRRRIG